MKDAFFTLSPVVICATLYDRKTCVYCVFLFSPQRYECAYKNQDIQSNRGKKMQLNYLNSSSCLCRFTLSLPSPASYRLAPIWGHEETT